MILLLHPNSTNNVRVTKYYQGLCKLAVSTLMKYDACLVPLALIYAGIEGIKDWDNIIIEWAKISTFVVVLDLGQNGELVGVCNKLKGMNKILFITLDLMLEYLESQKGGVK